MMSRTYSRRGMLHLLSATSTGFALPWALPAATAAAGAPTAAATPVTAPVVGDYAEVAATYEAAREAALRAGRENTELLFAGETTDLYDRLSPQVKGLLTAGELDALLPSLETDRVHLEASQVNGVFDGRLDGRTIEGYFSQGGVSSLRLQAVDQPSSTGPLDGRWEGEIAEGGNAEGGNAVAIVVTFATVDGALTATLDVPAQGISGWELTNVSYRPSVPIGDRIDERALPFAPSAGSYAARYAWGDGVLVVSFGFDQQETITSFSVAPEWPLPPDPAAGVEPTTTLRPPFVGLWWVVWGGDTLADNYHVATPNQRHAYDILIWKDGGTRRGDGSRNEDYWCWGQPVLAPAAGRIVEVVDGIPDNVPGVMNPEPHLAGNHVVIETARDEFVLIAHFQQGSIRVKSGDRVKMGQEIGRTGNSGNSSEPHIHIHLQNRADFFAQDAIGLPLRFVDYLENGVAVAEGAPTQGQFVASRS